MLDIIVTHYDEPWSVGKKFFDMLALQRGIDFDRIRVLLIHDGLNRGFPQRYFKEYPYKVEQHKIPHGGVSAARNEGLRLARRQWVEFCDFDDTYAHVYTLRDLFDHLPTEKYDLLWTGIIAEEPIKGSHRLNLYRRKSQDVVFCHGKFYRREFLLQNDIWFDTELTFNEDSLFNATIAAVITDPHRMGELKGIMPDYVWCARKGSVTKTPGRKAEAMLGTYIRQKKLCEVHKRLLPKDRYDGQVARTIWDLYYMLNRDNTHPILLEMKEDFRSWLKEHQESFDLVDENLMKQIVHIAKLEHYDVYEKEFQENPNMEQEEGIGRFREEIGIREWMASMLE